MTPREQHLATRSSAGLFDFSFMGLYEFPEGKQLNELQTRQLQNLAPGQIAYTLLLNEAGAVLIDATVWRLDDGRFWLFTGKRGKYPARDRSGEYAILALQGPASGALLARLIGRDAVLGLKYFHFTRSKDLIVARLGYSGELGYELLVPAARAPELTGKLIEQGVLACTFDAADTLRIESGYVLFDRELDGHANPRELGLERFAGSSRDFPLTKKLVGLEFTDKTDSKAPLARVTSECFSHTFGKRIALGFAPPDAGDAVRLAGGRAARIVPLPFYDPERQRPRGAPL